MFHENDYMKNGIRYNSEIEIKNEYAGESDDDEEFVETYTPPVTSNKSKYNKKIIEILKNLRFIILVFLLLFFF